MRTFLKILMLSLSKHDEDEVAPYRKFPQKRWMRRQASSSALFDVA